MRFTALPTRLLAVACMLLFVALVPAEAQKKKSNARVADTSVIEVTPVESAIERERSGLPQREALLQACRERARPIVMTTVAMAAGMLPTAFALEKGSEFRQPMAVAVIGGLITSTMLSLVLVPVVYEFVDDFEQWLRPKLARLVTPREAPAPPEPPAGPILEALGSAYDWLLGQMPAREIYPPYGESAVQVADDYQEVDKALDGETSTFVRSGGRTVVTWAWTLHPTNAVTARLLPLIGVFWHGYARKALAEVDKLVTAAR